MNALTKIENTAITTMPEAELLEVLQSSLYPGAELASIKMVLGYCKASGLDPMRKPVHIVPMWDAKAKRMRDVIMPGIGLYRTDAARTGEYAGITEPDFGPDVTETLGGQQITYPQWCRVTVSRRMPSGKIVKFTAREFWKENYAVRGGQEKSIAPNAMWTKRPYGQLGKCSEAQALRKAFPEVGSQPTADEMEGKAMSEDFQGTTVDAGTGKVVHEALPPCTAEYFDKNLPAWLTAITASRATADQIIAKASTKYMLTDAQREAIRAVPKADPAFTFEKVSASLNAAMDIDALYIAADLIGEVLPPEKRVDLTVLFEECRATLEGGA